MWCKIQIYKQISCEEKQQTSLLIYNKIKLNTTFQHLCHIQKQIRNSEALKSSEFKFLVL